MKLHAFLSPISRMFRVLLVISAGAIYACGSNQGESKSSNLTMNSCRLPEDQSDTIMGRWPLAPIQIAFHKDSQFSESERQAVFDAAEKWNAFYRQSHGFSLFGFSSQDHEGYSYQCENGEPIYDSAGNFRVPVVIYKRTSGMDENRNIIASTNTCLVNVNQKIKAIRAGQIELNYQFYFSGTLPKPDFKTTFVHELGHLVGLDHSCEFEASGKQRVGMPDCQALASRVYFSAAMFPSTDSKLIRDSLNTNDQERANCLYDEDFIKDL